MAAAGRVTTGFSLPYVALYAASGGSITYSSGAKLARGVDVTISPESSDDNKFYADNQVAEEDSGRFTGGTISGGAATFEVLPEPAIAALALLALAAFLRRK